MHSRYRVSKITGPFTQVQAEESYRETPVGILKTYVTVQDVQNNRPQTRALHALSLHSQLLSEANGRSAHSEIKNSSYCKQVCIV